MPKPALATRCRKTAVASSATQATSTSPTRSSYKTPRDSEAGASASRMARPTTKPTTPTLPTRTRWRCRSCISGSDIGSAAEADFESSVFAYQANSLAIDGDVDGGADISLRNSLFWNNSGGNSTIDLDDESIEEDPG